MTRLLPTYFISHGGGPWPWLEDEAKRYERLKTSLQELSLMLGDRVSAILAISGHWETEEFTVMSSPAPSMVYDYSGFPAHTYTVSYAAPGSPSLARRVGDLLSEAALLVRYDEKRGYDHGVFSPLAVAYPEAKIPVLQLSIQQSYDPAVHLAVGRALAPLRSEEVLIIGSGLSYHNLRRFGASAEIPSREFDLWLTSAVCIMKGKERSEQLLKWEEAPSARIAHPQEDHLIPLMVAVGAAEEEEGRRFYHEEDFMGGVVVSSFQFGEL